MTHCQIQKDFEIFSPLIEVPVCEASHSPQSVGKLKNAWSITYTMPHVFVFYAQLVTEKS